MKYFSTRGQIKGISFEDAVFMGLAEDGGLLLPETIPSLSERDLKHLSELNYRSLAFEIIKRFASGIPDNDLREIIEKSYSSFDTPEVIPVVKAGGVRIAELFHGPTFAFKDLALQFVGNLFEYLLSKRGRIMNVVGATSGDTGSAAIYGVRGKENVNIFILYPKGRISPVQEAQMTSVKDSNVRTLSVSGNFDDCQNVVKELFGDLSFKKEYSLGAVNSINWARIAAQIVYYFYVYFKAAARVGDPVNIVVPTGNFGNIFAGYTARAMGLPVAKLLLASNRNNILTRAVKFGDYSIERVRPTHSPSMDIQVASNFERYLYYLYGNSSEKVCEAMESLRDQKEIEFRGEYLRKIQRDFIASDAMDEEVEKIIKTVYDKSEYIVDPHTACGIYGAYKMEIADYSTVCLATAHPGKFPEVIADVLGFEPPTPDALQHDGRECVPSAFVTCDADEIKNYIREHSGN